MKRILTALTLALCMTCSTAMAEDKPLRGVVELFTSQGCNSCPPADANFERLVKGGDVLALAFHVDYWNYLGWKDTLGSKQNTERQYGYAKAMKRQGVYTPQVVVNGRVELVGSHSNGIEAQLDALNKSRKALDVPVHAVMQNGEIDISIGDGEGKADVLIAYYKENEAVKITRGENAGKTIGYVNSVTDLETVGMWDGRETKLRLPSSVLAAKEGYACAVLLQSYNAEGEPGPIYGAAIVKDIEPTLIITQQ